MSLIRSLEVDREFEHYFDSNHNQQDNPQTLLISNLQVELIAIMKIMFAIYYKPWKKPSKNECQLMIRYINESTNRHYTSLLDRLGNQQ